jgi:hypothetical protein
MLNKLKQKKVRIILQTTQKRSQGGKKLSKSCKNFKLNELVRLKERRLQLAILAKGLL